MANFDITKTQDMRKVYDLMPTDPIKVHGEMKVDMGLLMKLFAETDDVDISLKEMIQYLDLWEIPMSEAVRKLGYAAGVLWTYEDTNDEETWNRMDKKYREMEREMEAKKSGAEI